MDIVSLPSSGQLLRISNWSSSAGKEIITESISKVLESEGVLPEDLKVIEGTLSSVVLRFNSDSTDHKNVLAKLDELSIGGTRAFSIASLNLRKPALFVRKLKEVSESSFKQLFANDTQVERIEWERASSDLMNDLAVVYFSSEQAAFKTLLRLKGISLDGQKLSVVFR